MVRANKNLGPNSKSTEYTAYLNLKRSYEHGLMHENFVESFKKMEEKFKKFTEEFQPIYLLRFAWIAFWELRQTKVFESPITHLDIKSYTEVMCVDINPQEARLILGWDRLYYKYMNKYEVR